MIKKVKDQDFEIVSGNDLNLNFVHKNEAGTIVPITGAIISFALAVSEQSKSRIIFYTSPTNVTITDAAQGKYTVAIQASDTEPLTPRKYRFEVRITSAGGEVHTAARGEVTVIRNIIDT